MIKKLILFLFLYCSPLLANAGLALFIEPYFHYGLGNYTVSQNIVTDKDARMKIYGLKFGSHIGSFFIYGLDIERSSGDLFSFCIRDGGSFEIKDVPFTRLSLGTYVGIQVAQLRMWLSYRITDKVKFNFEEDVEEKKEQKGRGFKLGIGFRIAPFTSLNFEMIHHKAKSVPNDFKVNLRTYSIGLSFPLAL